MDRRYVGIDFRRRRSVIVGLSAAGEKLPSVRVANEPWAIAAVVAGAGPDPEVVVEATDGWYWGDIDTTEYAIEEEGSPVWEYVVPASVLNALPPSAEDDPFAVELRGGLLIDHTVRQ
jgi:hypothetical protein